MKLKKSMDQIKLILKRKEINALITYLDLEFLCYKNIICLFNKNNEIMLFLLFPVNFF